MIPTETTRAVEVLLQELLAELRRRSDRILDIHDVSARTSLSRSRIFDLEQQGNFPRRRQIAPNRVGWLESEIDRWIADRPTVCQAHLIRR
jgi:prophage regulatory protein